MDIDTALLSEIGLSEGEIKVYLALMSLGASSTGPIIKESKVHASKVYPILDRLVDKGLVGFVKEGKKSIYRANPPTMITSFLEKKEADLKTQKKEAQRLIRQLELLQTISEAGTDATIFKGRRGIKAAHDLLIKDLKKGDELLDFGLTKQSKSWEIYFQHFQERRVKKGAKLKQLVSEEYPWLDEYVTFRKHLPNTEIKFLPKHLLFPSVMEIWHDKVLITVLEGEGLSILIENKEVAESFRTQFYAMWKQPVQVYYGKEGPTRVLDLLAEEGKKGLPNYGFGTDENPYTKYLPDELAKFWDAEKKHKITTKLLFMEGGEHQQPNADIRYLPKEFVSPLRIMMAGDMVALADFTEPWTTVIIRKQEIADAFIKQFQLLWKIAEHPTRIYTGKEGPIKVLHEIVEACKKGGKDFINYGYGTDEDDWAVQVREELDAFIKESERLKMKTKLIFSEGYMPPNHTAEVRHLPKSYFAPVRTIMFADTVAIVDFTEPITTIMIKNQAVAKSYMQHFEILWKLAKK